MRLQGDALRLHGIAARLGCGWVGGTDLFGLYETPSAPGAKDFLARHQIWCQIFPWSDGWIRLGLPGSAADWDRLEAVVKSRGTERL